jgi:hypothetical protein
MVQVHEEWHANQYFRVAGREKCIGLVCEAALLPLQGKRVLPKLCGPTGIFQIGIFECSASTCWLCLPDRMARMARILRAGHRADVMTL